MTKIKLPDPMVEVDKHITAPELQYTYLAPAEGLEHGTELITTDQAEAYKDACVREALEEAATICWEMQSSPECGKDDKDHWLSIAERRIRKLIPEDGQ